MTYQSHLAWAAGAAISSWAYVKGVPSTLDQAVLFSILVASALIGGLLPDIDHPQSWLGRRIPILPRVLYKTTGHRGATHSFIALVSVVIGSWYLVLQVSYVYAHAETTAAGVLIGYGSHLVGDFISNRGIPIFWPASKRFGIPLCNTGSAGERTATIGAVFLFGAMSYCFIQPNLA